MTVTVSVVSAARHAWYKCASVGGIVGFIFCSILLIHILYHYCKLFPHVCKSNRKRNPSQLSKSLLHNKHTCKKQTNPRPYHLFICYLITSMLVCLFISLIRSNIITDITQQRFTDELCAIGYFGNYSLLTISKALMYNLFNYRIQIIFTNTQYSFHKMLYLTMYILPWYNVLFVIVCLYIGQFEQNNHSLEWILQSDETSYILFCGGTTNFRLAIKIFIIHASIIEFIMSVTLLLMFCKGLYDLYQTLLTQHIDEYMNRDGSIYSSDSNESNGVDAFSVKKTMTMSFSSHLQCEKKSIIRVISLKNIIKKQTILVCIALISSIIYWVLSMFYPSMSLQSCWDIIINASCIWLMFACTNPIWNFLSRYCCCHICYRDINHMKNNNQIHPL
eukprot:450449_1